MKNIAVFLAVIVAGCSSETTLRLKLSYDASWGLDTLGVDVVDKKTMDAAMAHELRLIVPDGWAPGPLAVDVWGKHGAEKRAWGRADVSPIAHREVSAEVVLTKLPCGAWCAPGGTECISEAVATCQSTQDGCTDWGAPTACPPDRPYCSFGVCGASCIDECATGETRCEGPGGLRICGKDATHPCLHWLPALTCPMGQACSNGACQTTCSDECSAGQVRCLGNGTMTCGDYGHDGCLEWGPVTPCGAGLVCSNGQCSATCTDECTSNVCDGKVFRQCGHFGLDSCNYLSAGTSCVPTDACLEGRCDAAGCMSAPRVCKSPPASSCVNANTLRVYDTSGSCSGGGGCTYASHDVACANCPACDACAAVTCNTPPSVCFAATGTCASGSCTYPYADAVTCDDGNACTDSDACKTGVCAGTPKSCNTPPPPVCMNATTLRTYSSTGSCTAGTCNYPYSDMSCTCSTGACAPQVPAIAVAGGASHSCALVSGGDVKCWGDNTFGQLGNNSTVRSDVPVSVQGLAGPVSAITAGNFHTCALLSTGGVQCWGHNADGQLGNGSTADSAVPVSVQALNGKVIAIDAGELHTCAVLSVGGVQCWGFNGYGQLGNKSTTSSTLPVVVQGLAASVRSVAAGYIHTCALLSTDSVQCWGANANGRLGNDSTADSLVPVSVQPLAGNAAALSAGDGHTCALLSSGSVQCWGRNNYGQLGDQELESHVPLSVQGLAGSVSALSAGAFHTCALLNDGRVQCWGSNNAGQLGNHSATQSNVPITVQGLAGSATAIAAGNYHTCTVSSAGGVQCWGSVPISVAGL